MTAGVGIGLSVVAIVATAWWLRQSDAAFAPQLAAAKARNEAGIVDYVTAGVQVYSAYQGGKKK